MNRISNLLWGIVLITIGLIIGLNVLGIAKIDLFFDGWWTLFIIVPCAIDLFKDKGKTGNIIGLTIGICLLLGCQDLLDFNIIWKLTLPFILITFGLSFIFKDTINSKIKKEIKKLNTNDLQEYCSTFGFQTVEYDNEEFKGCNLSAIFGGIRCNLQDAIIKDDTVIEVSAIFGGVTIYVPKDVNVKISSTPIFGGASNERKIKNEVGRKTVYVKALSMFGGVEVK